MTKLSLRHCSLVTDAAVVALSRHCHHLRMAMLNDTQVGDVGMEALARGCESVALSVGPAVYYAYVQ